MTNEILLEKCKAEAKKHKCHMYGFVDGTVTPNFKFNSIDESGVVVCVQPTGAHLWWDKKVNNFRITRTSSFNRKGQLIAMSVPED